MTERNFPIGGPVLEVKNISLSFGGVKAITDTSFNVLEHEIRAIIGPNGAGKSSMLNCINGIYKPHNDEQLNKGVLTDKEGKELDTVILGKALSLVKKHIESARKKLTLN